MPAVVGSLLVQSANPLAGFRNARKPKLLGFVCNSAWKRLSRRSRAID
jgi:hypothetical protein